MRECNCLHPMYSAEEECLVSDGKCKIIAECPNMEMAQLLSKLLNDHMVDGYTCRHCRS